MKAVQTTLVFFARWLPILAAAGLVAWDFWGQAPIRRDSGRGFQAVSARDGRLHVLSVTFGSGRTVEGVTFDGDRNVYRIELSDGALSGPFIVAPPPLLSPSLGFQSMSFTTAATGTSYQRLVIPEWPLVLGLVALPPSGLLFRHVRRRRRKILGQCVHCGQGLDGARGSCPTCGRTAPTAV